MVSHSSRTAVSGFICSGTHNLLRTAPAELLKLLDVVNVQIPDDFEGGQRLSLIWKCRRNDSPWAAAHMDRSFSASVNVVL